MFGSLCYVHNQKGKRDNFARKSRCCTFVGYSYGKKGWKLYNLNPMNTLFLIDFEIEFPFSREDSNGSENLSKIVFQKQQKMMSLRMLATHVITMM